MQLGPVVSRLALRVWRRKLYTRGRPITDDIAYRQSLVLAPHPDDETFGCGATIVRKRRVGTPVKVVIATDGRHSSSSHVINELDLAKIRAAEAIEALGALGVGPEDIVLLGHEDRTLDRASGELKRHLQCIVEGFAPEEILVTSLRDGHPDHVALGLAVRAILPSLRSVRYVAEYPTWYWYAGPFHRSPAQSLVRAALDVVHSVTSNFTDIEPELVATEGCLSAKRTALRAYRSQTRNITGESTWSTLPEGFCECFLGPYEVFFPVVVRRESVSNVNQFDRESGVHAAE